MVSRLWFIISCLLLLPTLSAPAAPLTYKDKLGRTVTIRTPVKRAVLYETYELLPVTGSWNQVAGISRYAKDNDLLRAVKPDFLLHTSLAGSAMDTNAESLLKLKPDVVLTWTVNPDIIRFLEKKGIPVIAVYPESLPELYEVMRLQGKLFGREKNVEKTIARMEEIFYMIRSRTASIPVVRRKKAIYLTGKPTKVNGRVGVTHDLFTMMGLDNGGREIDDRSAEVSLERIMGWNPDLIFIWGSARYSARDLMNNPQWRHIKAIRNRDVHREPKWGTWSPRLAPIALWMAATAYPDRFRDIDLNKTIDRFFRDVYGIPYAKVSQIER
jgi:iron complex transport system substrate-binding protein